MKFLDASEASAWKKLHAITAPRVGESRRDDSRLLFSCKVPEHAGKHYWFSRYLESELRPWAQCIMSIEERGIWESSENWHLYDSLCQALGNPRPIQEASTLCFDENEKNKVVTFVQVCLGMGLGFSLLTENDRCRVFVSHDEWVCFSKLDEADFKTALRAAQQSHLEIIK